MVIFNKRDCCCQLVRREATVVLLLVAVLSSLLSRQHLEQVTLHRKEIYFRADVERSLHPYAQTDIMRFVVNESKLARHRRITKFHLLVFANGNFYVYHLYNTNRLPWTPCYCQEHSVENIIDGVITARKQRFNSSASPPPWQLLMDIFRDYIYYPCMDNGTDGCLLEGNNYPPVVTNSAIPKIAKVKAPFLHQIELIHYNECIYRVRLEDSSGCWLREQVDQFTNATAWENLTSQIYWRGSSFEFLIDMDQNGRCPNILPQPRLNLTLTQVADQMLQRSDLTPRCRAVIMSGKAQEEWLLAHNNTFPNETTTSLPWLNIKFGGNTNFHMDYRKAGYDEFVESFVDPLLVANYKYQLDLGGAGGTTWTGTIMKLAMPGLLFHHETPTKDLFHDELLPWIHFVPIHTNLSNLYDAFLWAESHPEEAQQIARQGQEYARQHVTDTQIRVSFEKYYVDQLGEIVDAYEPPKDESLESILQGYEKGGFNATMLASCNGTKCNWFRRQITTLQENENRLIPL